MLNEAFNIDCMEYRRREMGFKCPACKADFGNSRQSLSEHMDSVHGIPLDESILSENLPAFTARNLSDVSKTLMKDMENEFRESRKKRIR